MYIVKFPKEMDELEKIFVPYLDKMYRLKKDAPVEVVEAYEKYKKIASEFWGTND